MPRLLQRPVLRSLPAAMGPRRVVSVYPFNALFEESEACGQRSVVHGLLVYELRLRKQHLATRASAAPWPHGRPRALSKEASRSWQWPVRPPLPCALCQRRDLADGFSSLQQLFGKLTVLGERGLLLFGKAVELGAGLAFSRGLELAAGSIDIAAPRRAHRRGNARIKHDLGKAANPLRG